MLETKTLKELLKEIKDQEANINEKEIPKEYNNILVNDLNLSNRLYNICQKNNINTLSEFILTKITDFQQFNNCGKTSLMEIIKLKYDIFNNKINFQPNIKKIENEAKLSPKFYNIEKEKIKIIFTEDEYEKYLDFGIQIALLTINILGVQNRNAEIFKQRMGISDDNTSTLEKIGLKYNLTRERTRQIILKSINELKKYKNDYIVILNNIAGSENLLNYFLVGIMNTFNVHFLKVLLDIIDLDIYDIIAIKINLNIKEEKSLKLENYYNDLEKRIYELINFPCKTKNASNFFEKLVTERHPFKVNNIGTRKLYKLNVKSEYESLMEKKIIYRFGQFSFVKSLKTQSLSIDYDYDNKHMKYYPDIQILTKDNKLIIIEVKPIYNMMDKHVIEKYNALKNYCHKNGYGYVMIDEKYNTIESILSLNIDKKLEENFINFVKNKGQIDYNEYKNFKFLYPISMKETVKIVLSNNNILECTIRPFVIKYLK